MKTTQISKSRKNIIQYSLEKEIIYYGNVNLIAPLDDDLYVFKWKDKKKETHAITGFYKLAEYPTKDTIEDYTLGDSRYSVSSTPIPITYNSPSTFISTTALILSICSTLAIPFI